MLCLMSVTASQRYIIKHLIENITNINTLNINETKNLGSLPRIIEQLELCQEENTKKETIEELLFKC